MGTRMDYLAAVASSLSSTPIKKCPRAKAVHWFIVSEAGPGLSGCMREGMLAAARSRLLREDDYRKVFCKPQGTRAVEAAKQAGK